MSCVNLRKCKILCTVVERIRGGRGTQTVQYFDKITQCETIRYSMQSLGFGSVRKYDNFLRLHPDRGKRNRIRFCILTLLRFKTKLSTIRVLLE